MMVDNRHFLAVLQVPLVTVRLRDVTQARSSVTTTMRLLLFCAICHGVNGQGGGGGGLIERII
ncbi:hypothetical protein TELCIR_17135, partial [Teladorsagia circumcincta]